MAREESIAFKLRSAGHGVEVHSGMAMRGRRPYLVARNDVVLMVGAQAAGVRCRRSMDALPPALLSVVQPGEVLVLDLPTIAPIRALHLPPGLLADAFGDRMQILREASQSGRRVLWVAAGAGMCQLADRVERADGITAVVGLAIPFLGPRVRMVAEEPVAHPVVCHVRDHIQQTYAQKVRLEELAKSAGMCRSALVRAFTRQVGLPPHAYRIHLRISRAQELITEGWPLSDVSLEVGFADQSHLNRHFKRLIGISPGRYARAINAPAAITPFERTAQPAVAFALQAASLNGNPDPATSTSTVEDSDRCEIHWSPSSLRQQAAPRPRPATRMVS
jgi:AraC-like DNA-binding protein